MLAGIGGLLTPEFPATSPSPVGAGRNGGTDGTSASGTSGTLARTVNRLPGCPVRGAAGAAGCGAHLGPDGRRRRDGPGRGSVSARGADLRRADRRDDHREQGFTLGDGTPTGGQLRVLRRRGRSAARRPGRPGPGGSGRRRDGGGAGLDRGPVNRLTPALRQRLMWTGSLLTATTERRCCQLSGCGAARLPVFAGQAAQDAQRSRQAHHHAHAGQRLAIQLMVTEVITKPSPERGQRFLRPEFAEELRRVPGDARALP
jgi:hypothetical protein